MIEYHWKGRRYNVVAGTYGNYVDLHPIYGDKLSIKHSMPDNERYYKESFNGTLKFVRDDYTWIMATIDSVTRFNTIYELELWTQTQKVTTLKFVITDCEVDEDNGIITVKPSTKSRYDDLLNGLDREFNLVKLNPVIEELQWFKRAALQVYVAGETAITNFLGTIHWEQDVDAITDVVGLCNNEHFGLCPSYREVIITGSYNTALNGRYSGYISANLETFNYSLYATPDNGYRVNFESITQNDTHIYSLSILRNSDDHRMAYYAYSSQDVMPDAATNVQLYSQDHGGDLVTQYATYYTYRVLARIICDVDYIGQYQTFSIGPDGWGASPSYTHVYPYSGDISKMSRRTTTDITEYGQNDDGDYYLPPDDNFKKWLPLSQSNWGEISVWYDMETGYFNDSQARKAMSLRHAYPLYSAIKVLLAQIAPDLSFDETTAYSQFLFDYNENTHPLVQDVVHLFITPKTNILNGDYKTPAYNAPIKLKEILDMLKAVYKCYWFIDTDNKLRIEHVSWFMNGGTYGNPSQTISYDLTTLKNSRNMKAWAYDKNKYSFAKSDMPATYTFAWMDEVTQEFKGYQMEMTSQLVEKGKNEEINVGKFTSDIDFVTITPDDISKDGFMLLGATYEKEAYYLPFYPLRIQGTNIVNYLQNGFLAYIYLEKNAIWLDNLPAGGVNYADGDYKAIMKQSRNKQQDVVVPMTTPIFDPITLIRTGLGNGEIQDIEINLSSLTGKAKLIYDTQ